MPDRTLPIAYTQPCSLCGKPADSIGLEDDKLYCPDCIWGGKVPQQPFEWLPSEKEEEKKAGIQIMGDGEVRIRVDDPEHVHQLRIAKGPGDQLAVTLVVYSYDVETTVSKAALREALMPLLEDKE